MKTIKKFQYFSPATVEEAASLLAQHSEQAKILAGGTDLLVMMKDKAIAPKYLINLKNIPGLEGIRLDGGNVLKIGALTSITSIKESDIVRKKFTSLWEAAESFGTTQVRNMATLGGNICRSSPSADMIPPLLAHDASVILVGQDGERDESLERFFTGPGKNILKNEILTEIRVKLQDGPCGDAFTKLGRSSEDLAKINCAVKIVMRGRVCEDIGIAFGAVAPTPIRARKTEAIIKGKEVDDDLIEKTAQNITEDISPITDLRSNIAYRKEVSKVLVKRLIQKSISRVGK